MKRNSKLILNSSLILSLFLAYNSCSVPNIAEKENENISEKVNKENIDEIKTEEAPPKVEGISFDLTENKTFLGIKIIDAKTNENISNEVKVSVEGIDSKKVEKESYSTKNGLLNIYLNKGEKATKENPIYIKLSFNSENYFDSNLSVILDSDNLTSHEVKLVNKSSTPKGVTAVSESINLKNSQVGDTLNIKATESENNLVSEIKIDSGTQMIDKNGNILSGDVKIDVGYFSNNNEESISSFPGGFNNIDLENESGYFTTGGFLSMDIKDKNGNEVEKFSKPVSIDMEIPENTINPETNEKIKEGDNIDIWSLDSDTGEWKLENKGNISRNDNGKLSVNYSINHLSYWNLDWFSGTRCNPKLKFNWEDKNTKAYVVKVLITFPDNPYFKFTGYLRDEINTLKNVPANRDLNVAAYYNNELIGEKRVRLSQGSASKYSWYAPQCKEDIEIDLKSREGKNVWVIGKVKVKDEKTNTDIFIKPTIPFWYKQTSKTDWKLGKITSGYTKIFGIPNKEYDFKVLFNGKEYKRTSVFPENKRTIYLDDINLTGIFKTDFLTGFAKSTSDENKVKAITN